MRTFATALTAMWFSVYWTSCSIYVPQYDISSKSEHDIILKEVVASSQVRDRFGEGRIARADSEDVQRYVFQNEGLTIFWIPTEFSMAFILENKTEDSLMIMWRDAAYIDVEGVAGKVTHGGVKYGEFFYSDGRAYRPTVIASKGRVADMVLPMASVSLNTGEMLGTGNVYPMLPGEPEQYVGKTIQVLLPFKMEGTVVEYTFVFDINGPRREK